MLNFSPPPLFNSHILFIGIYMLLDIQFRDRICVRFLSTTFIFHALRCNPEGMCRIYIDCA